MIKPPVLTIVFAAMLSMAAVADDQVCPVKNKPHALNEQSSSTAECNRPDKSCERNEVGVLNWLTDSHSTPSLHFIDFMEVFMH